MSGLIFIAVSVVRLKFLVLRHRQCGALKVSRARRLDFPWDFRLVMGSSSVSVIIFAFRGRFVGMHSMCGDPFYVW